MRRGAKRWAALAALLAAFGLVACGGEEESDPTAAEATSGSAAAEADPGDANADGDESGGGSDRAPSEPPGEFKPERHEDSGGGAAQFRVRGGDNSVQEFGSEAGAAEFEGATAALHNFLDARAAGRWAAACSYLAEEIVASLEELASKGKGIEATGCAAILAKLTNPAAKGALRREARRADAGSVRVEGDRSFVIYRAGDETILAMPMKRDGGEWKVAGLAPAPLN